LQSNDAYEPRVAELSQRQGDGGAHHSWGSKRTGPAALSEGGFRCGTLFGYREAIKAQQMIPLHTELQRPYAL
jgi:hypothetical protein